MDEQSLMAQVKHGHRAAFTAIVSRYQGAVFGYLRARLTQPADADDLTQEVFLRLFEARGRFQDDHALRPWIMGIARNVLREHVRRVKRQRRREVAWTEVCLEVEELLRINAAETPHDDRYEEARLHLPECLDSLGRSARTAIDLRYGSRLGLAAIGERLRRSEGAVKLLMFRARQALRHCLNGKLGNGSDAPAGAGGSPGAGGNGTDD